MLFRSGFSYYIDTTIAQELSTVLNEVAQDFSAWSLKNVDQPDNAQLAIEKVEGLADDAYQLTVDAKGVRLQASHAKGSCYGLQCLLSLFPVNFQAGPSISLPFVQVQDAPRYAYRGWMLDISRNFKDLQTLKNYVDVMARYTSNTLKLHFLNDRSE